jgi:hypothetical protein
MAAKEDKKISLIVYIYVLLAAALLFLFAFKTTTGGDAFSYIVMALQLIGNNILDFKNDTRTLGYPLLLSFVYAFNKLFDLAKEVYLLTFIIVAVQFVLHCFTAYITVCIGESLKLIKSVYVKYIVFACIVLNPFLLSVARQTLTETLTTFLLIFALYIFIKKNYFLSGLFIGYAIITRPFYLYYFLALTLLFLAYQLYILLQKKWLTNLPVFTKVNLDIKPLSCALFLLPIITIVAFQFFLTFKHFNEFSFLPKKNGFTIHQETSKYSYKYDTHLGGELVQSHSAATWYFLRQQCHLNSSLSVVEKLHVTVVKFFGLFVTFGFDVYRFTLNNQFSFSTFIGFSLLFLYIVSVIDLLLHGLYKKLPSLFLHTVTFLHLALYTIFSVPETRFMYEVIPLITLLGVGALHNFMQKKQYWIITYLLVITAIIFIYSLNIIAESMA